ncbi:unnamed protein product [Pleuronectes platessa]|uniref:Uncharacterized protein n=1 Tax=Pleuronectes platessa TaxID=8262 RepID=A0A9N7UWX9_PLEPL|nr:unnamed protein product [Pleuronectes platessa]
MGLPTKSRKKSEHCICKRCGQPKTRECGHSRYRAQHFCSCAEGRSVKDWLEEKRAEEVAQRQQVSDSMPRTAPDTLPTTLTKSELDSSYNPSSSSSSPEPSTSAKAGNPPTRCTVYRRRMRSEKDRKILSGVSAKLEQPLDACDTCGLSRRLDTGHAYYRGDFFCSGNEGPGGKSPQEWLESRGGVPIPHTTLWRMKKAVEWPKEEEGQKKPRKQHKVRTCQSCGHSPLKDYGHSQLNLLRGKVSYCAMQDGISVDLWQARQRLLRNDCHSLRRRERRSRGREGCEEKEQEQREGGSSKSEDTE